MLTCNWLDLQTLGSRPIMPKISPITEISPITGTNRTLYLSTRDVKSVLSMDDRAEINHWSQHRTPVQIAHSTSDEP